jgi:hypothetical protein
VAKSAEKDRKVRVEEMRRAQQAAERRRTMLVVGAAVAVVVLLAGIVTKVVLDSQADRDMTRIGATAAAASCDAVTTDKTVGSGVHIGPGTDQPNKLTVKYATVPPTSGEHYVTPEYPARAFYTAEDRPALETLVHNLEHGYTVVWYTASTPQAQVDQLKRIADLARKDKATGGGKFIVSAWDDSRGAFPAGKTIGMSHWGAQDGHRQMCGAVSGAAIKDFITKFPSTDSPEPNGA